MDNLSTKMDAYETSKCNTKRHRKLIKLLEMVYGYSSYKPKQYEIINNLINGADVCAILPTGYGKSLTFQIPALYLDKTAIIISPLISLMEDQQIGLKELGISSCCYNSNVADKSLLKQQILKGDYKFIYITPESAITIQEFFLALDQSSGISLIAIDEAHCISSYGFDFRKSYRELTFFKKLLPHVPILAVTATATKVVGTDICEVLGFNSLPIKTSFDRPNLYLEVNKKNKIEEDIVKIVKNHPHQSIIIYCVTKKETAKIAQILQVHGIDAGIYHAGLDNSLKTENHLAFLSNSLRVMVATIAFGMGINKPDVRVVIHYGSPKNLEGYYQEIGRAGRDNNKAYCYAFYNFSDFKIQESLIASGTDPVFKKTQLALLAKIKMYMTTRQCRRQVLLHYFDETFNGCCDFCDNCTGKTVSTVQIAKTTLQNVKAEAQLLIQLIENQSSKMKKFGLTIYFNILRESNNKSITPEMKKSCFYGAGKHKSLNWWKELGEKLVELQFIQQTFVKGGFFTMQVVSVGSKGLDWISELQLTDMLNNTTIDDNSSSNILTAVEMTTCV